MKLSSTVSEEDDDDDVDKKEASSAKKCKEEVITPLVELPQATVVHQLLQQGHSEVSINGIVAQNGTTTLQVRTFSDRSFAKGHRFHPHRQVAVQPQEKRFHRPFY